MNLIESSFDVTTAKRASAHPVFNVSYPGYVVLIIYDASNALHCCTFIIQNNCDNIIINISSIYSKTHVLVVVLYV